MARELRLLLQTDTVFISNGAIPAPLRLQKRITPCGRVLYVSATYPDNLVTKTYIKYRKGLGADWATRQANNNQGNASHARSNTVKISVDELRELTVSAIKRYGYNDNDTAVISDVLLYAQLRGNNQGIAKLIGKGIPVNADAGDITTVKDTPISARIDGGQNHSMVVLDKAQSQRPQHRDSASSVRSTHRRHRAQ